MNMNTTKLSNKHGQTLMDSTANVFSGYRLAYSAASAALIGSVYVVGTAPLGIFLVMPLIAIYTGLAVVLGHSPLTAILDANAPIPYVVAPTSDIAATRKEQHAASRAA